MSTAATAAFPGVLQLASDTDVSECLDALESAECTRDEFIGEMIRREHDDPQIGWEALETLDQHFRHRKIGREDFTILKAMLYRHMAPSGQETSSATPRNADGTAEPAEPRLAEVSFHSELHAGDRLCDRYLVVEILRRTAAGTLVEAIDETQATLPGARQRVAIQIVDEALAQEPEFLSRIGNLQNLSHPAIARFFDVVKHDGALLLVMELLNGASLHNLLARNEGQMLHVAVAQAALRALAQALSHAHSRGIAHGDVSARNVMLTHSGEFRLQGFEMHDPRVAADAAGDRMAFSALACKLLTGPRDSRHGPAGVSSAQWAALRNQGDALAIFASSLPEKLPRSAARAHRKWGVAASIAAVLGVGAFLYAASDPNSPDQRDVIDAPSAATLPLAAAPEQNRTSEAFTGKTAERELPVSSSEAAAAESGMAIVARPRIDLPSKADLVETTAPVARIWVRRRGNLDGPVTFTWWTESGSAEVDRDFRAIAPRTATIPDGARGVELLVPLMPDADRREPRTFYVKIDNPQPRAILGGTTLMQIAIVPPGYPAQRPGSS